jgi:hypothetical protein
MNGIGLSALNSGTLLMKFKIISPLRSLLTGYITIVYVALRLSTSLKRSNFDNITWRSDQGYITIFIEYIC